MPFPRYTPDVAKQLVNEHFEKSYFYFSGYEWTECDPKYVRGALLRGKCKFCEQKKGIVFSCFVTKSDVSTFGELGQVAYNHLVDKHWYDTNPVGSAITACRTNPDSPAATVDNAVIASVT